MAVADPVALASRPGNLWRDTAKSIVRQRSSQVGLVMLILLIVTAIFPLVIAIHDPLDPIAFEEGIDAAVRAVHPPVGCPEDRPEHFFGVDRNGRDVSAG